MRAEAQALRSLIAGFSGMLAVQIGAPEQDFLPVGHYTDLIKLDAEGSGAALRARADALPLAEACVDLVLLVYVLDRSPEPAAILAESARVLRAEGRLVIVARRRALWASAMAGRRHFVGCRRLRALIEEAGLVWRGGAGFAPGTRVRLRSARCPHLSAFSYTALAIKRVVGMTVLKPAWSDSRERRRSRILQGQSHAG